MHLFPFINPINILPTIKCFTDTPALFEFLNKPEIRQIIVSGPRCCDYKLRLLVAGIPAERIVCEPDEFKAVDIMDKDIDKLYLLHDTSTYDLCCKVEEKMFRVFPEAQNIAGGEQK